MKINFYRFSLVVLVLLLSAANSYGQCSSVTLKTWNGSTNDEWTTAANWTPAGVPAPCDSVKIPTAISPRPKLMDNVTIHALTMESGTELFMNGYSITINGDVNIDAGQIGGGISFTAKGSNYIRIENSSLYINNINLNSYKGDLRFNFNSTDGFNTTSNVSFSDDAARVGYTSINANGINGNLSVTANSTNNLAYTSIAANADDYSYDNINGNVTFIVNSQGGSFKVGDYRFHISGNLSVNSNFISYPTLGNIDFNGGTDSHIKQLGSAPIEISGVYTNKNSANNYIVLDQDVFIKSNFSFGTGIVKTAANKLLILNSGAGINQYSSNSYVWGPIKKIGNQQFNFPVGEDTYSSVCTMTAPTNVTDEFVVQYFHKNPTTDGYDTALHVSALNSVSGKEYWIVYRTNGTSNVQLSFLYDGTRSQSVQSVNGLRIARWSSSQWQDEGNGDITPSGNQYFVKTSGAISQFGPFTFGYTLYSGYVPKITIGAIDSIVCHQPQFLNRVETQRVQRTIGPDMIIPFTVDSPMVSNNVFKAELSDSTGSFANPVQIGSITSNHSDGIGAFIPSNTPSGYGYRIRIIGTSPGDTSSASTPFRIETNPGYVIINGPAPGCINSGVNKYYASKKEAGVTYSWTLSGGGTFTTNQDTAYVTWTTPGNYYISLTTSNSCGSGYPASRLITVSTPPPTAAPTLTNTGRWLYATQPEPNQNAKGYQWYRNDTLISGANNSSYYASDAGSFTVKYSNLCGVGPASNSISFAAASIPQTINFPVIPDKTYGDSDFVINATASSGLPVQFNVVSGPGNIPGNVYHITGTGTVTIRAIQLGDNVYDTAAPLEQTFTVNKAPQTITFVNISDKDYGAAPFILNATNSSGLPISYSVISGAATIKGNIVTLTGVGLVTIRASAEGDTNYLPATAVDKSFCVSVATLNPINGPIRICPNKPTTYSVDSIAGATYTWRIAGGSTLSSTSNKVIISWPSPGTYTLIVSAVGNCGAPSTNDSLVVIAIAGIRPDSVHNMLPANGAINQQLPLTLSWIPANPNLYYTYDVYLWRADQPQPSTPYAANITSVNYTIPLNSGLAYNTTYKWMVVAHNGSCIDINTGPVQQFSLIPLPDLEVYNVTAPSSAFSGQSISVTWKVKNNGPGITQLNQQWTDAIFISKDSILDFTNPANQLTFPIVPLLVAAKPNVSALNVSEFYSDTATFFLPRDYSGPLYTHVITNYAPPEINPVTEITKLNDSAHALPATIVALSPTTDLRVDTILNPNNTFSGSTINVTYKVKNYGVNSDGYWVDKVYISKDPIFNINNAILLKQPNSAGSYYYADSALFNHYGGLQHDSSYTTTFPVVVPNFIYGSYYIYVFTNATAIQYEGANQNNNINHGNLMEVFLTQTPQLVPVDISIPSNISNTQVVSISWKTQNQGAYNNIERNKGHYFLYPSLDCGNNQKLYRDVLGFGSSYWVDRMYISTDSSGLNNTAVLLNEKPQGIKNSGSFFGDFLPDICAHPGAQSAFNKNTDNVIVPGSTHPAFYNYVVPGDLPQGNYYIYVYSNATKTVFEYPGLPQITRSNKITLAWPELTVPVVSVPISGNSGQPVTVRYSIFNAGPGAVYNHNRKDYIYIGDNSTFDGTAKLIDTVFATDAIPANATLGGIQKQIKLPDGVSGTKYIFVRANADSLFKENNLYNNTNTSGAPINITLSPDPDLQVTSINMANTVYTSTGFPFKYVVTNTGDGIASGTWKDSIFISCNSTFNAVTSYFVALRTQQNYVPTGVNYTDSFNMILPFTFPINNSGCLNNDTAQLYFFIKTNADNGVYEGSLNNNNVLATGQKTVINSLVDHIVTNVTGSDSALVGTYFKVNWTVKNIGLNPNDSTYSPWEDATYLSPDSVFNNNAIYIGQKNESLRLNHNQSYTDSANYGIPNIVSGNYYVFVKTNVYNRITAERNLNNNTNLRRNGYGNPISVYVTNAPAPDLVVSIINAPAKVATGQPVTIVYMVKNIGQGFIYTNEYDNIWLSNSFKPEGLLIGSKPQNRKFLYPGQSYTDSMIVYISSTQAQGNYGIVVETNHGHRVYESDYSNNSDYKYISVYIPPPTDIVVNNITVADTVILGYPANISWNINNISNNPATGIETDGIYLGKSYTTETTDDVLIGTSMNKLNLLPLNSLSISSQPMIANVIEGSYFVKIKTDILNNIIETHKDNNTDILNHRIIVKIKNLPINVTTPDTLTSNYLFYKLIIPSSLRGKTISVKLTSNDSLSANNQIYIGLGYLPSAARFDYAYNTPNAGNQQIIIESATDSVYYIAAKSSSVYTKQVINLKAEVLPFAIVNVTGTKGGNTGNVTVQLKGSLFVTGMIATLRGVSANNYITASAVYFVNGTSVYATYNLQGAPLGVYDVQLQKPDGTLTSLPSSFTVEKGNNGGLLTGGGDNKGQSGSGNEPGCDPGATSGLNSQLQTEIIIPPKVFASWPFNIQINYTNTSNVDVPAQAKILYSLDGAPLSLTEAGLAEGKTSLYIEFKDAQGPPGIIRAGGSGTIKVFSKAPANAGAHSFLNYNFK